MITKKQKSDVKAFRMWSVMAAEDKKRLEWENRMGDCAGLHNAHVAELQRNNYFICVRATNEMEDRLELYPQA